jgi:LemA protein
MTPVTIGLVVLAAVVVALLLLYNRLVKLRNRSRAAWHDIDVYLRRRHDLVPNLVETVKAYASHERAVLDEVTRARSLAVAAEQRGRPGEVAATEEALAGAVSRLFAVAEAYPDLKADERFGDLQRELAATENKIAFSRQLFNDTVEAYRRKTQQVPGVVLARPLGFVPPEFFTAEEAARTPPPVTDL